MKKKKKTLVFRRGLGVLGYEVLFGVFGFMLLPTMVDVRDAIRIPAISILILCAFMLVWLSGSSHGESDCAMTETLDKLAKKGIYQPSGEEEGKRYYRMKGVWVALAGGALLFAACLCVALTSKPYAYTLQDAPGWVGGYASRPEIGDALAYMGTVEAKTGVLDYLMIGVRFLLFPYVCLMGKMSDAASLLFDRISPALSMLIPAVYAMGYQFGPRRRAKAVKEIEEAKRRPRKRLKKEARQRLAGKAPEKKELI